MGSEKTTSGARGISTYPIAYVTADVVLFTIHEDELQVVLIERGEAPAGMALPGGFLKPDEDLTRCALRELEEETGIRLAPDELEQLGSYGAPDRDPRYANRPNERVVTVAYWGIIPNLPTPRGGSDARRALLHPVSKAREAPADPARLRPQRDRTRRAPAHPRQDRVRDGRDPLLRGGVHARGPAEGL
ncbi:MAG: NUDIX domain-containing protein [Myxococcota bacterium]